MRAVIDTNVVVSAFLSPRGAPAHVFRHYHQDAFDLLVSQAILAEYQRALCYPKVQAHHHMDNQEIAAIVDDFKRAAVLVDPHVRAEPPLKDEDDTIFFSCALAGRAGYIVSGDRLVQDVGEYKGIQVVSPSLFLNVLTHSL